MTMVDNLAVVDYSNMDNTHDPVDVCPTATISDFDQAHPLKRFKPEKKKKVKKDKLLKKDKPEPKAVKDTPVDTGKTDNKEKVEAETRPAEVKEESTKDVG
jgi:hypothetical protein